MSVHNLITAISNGDALETEEQFNAVMADKISLKLDDLRMKVASSMFTQPSEEETSEE